MFGNWLQTNLITYCCIIWLFKTDALNSILVILNVDKFIKISVIEMN